MIKHKGSIKNAINDLENNTNNAVVYVYKNAKFSKGLLYGATITLKDLFATKNVPTIASSKILKGFIPGYDATFIKKIQKSGAAIVGKLHMDELGLGGTGGLSAFGIINNKLDKTRMPGGSSSGCATTFNKNISISFGTDTGDSIRLPGSYNGIIGFKPSYGAVSRYGLFAFASSLDTIGWFAHNVEDIIRVSQVVFGKDEKDFTSKNVIKPKIKMIKPNKIAILNMHNQLSTIAKKKYDEIIKKLKKDNIQITKIKISKDILNAIGPIYNIISFSEASSNDANLTGINFGKRQKGANWKEIINNSRSKGLGYMVQRRFILGGLYLLKQNQQEIFLKAQKVRRIIVNIFNKIYKENDALIYPTANIAPKWKDNKKYNWYSSFLSHNNLEGSASITIPFAKEKNMPIGLSIDTQIYSDKKLLSYALYFEKIIGDNYE